MENDLALVHRWRDGDSAAGNALFLRHFAAMRRFFRNKVDRTEAEDLIQRTFLACLESLDDYQAAGSFRAYLFAIARFVFLAHVRRRIRDGERRDPDLSVSSVLDLGTSPSAMVVKRETGGRVTEAMQRVPVDFQITLELYYWEQLTGPEIAVALGISPVTVRTRLVRARAALREALRALDPSCTAADTELEAMVVALRDSAGP